MTESYCRQAGDQSLYSSSSSSSSSSSTLVFVIRILQPCDKLHDYKIVYSTEKRGQFDFDEIRKSNNFALRALFS